MSKRKSKKHRKRNPIHRSGARRSGSRSSRRRHHRRNSGRKMAFLRNPMPFKELFTTDKVAVAVGAAVGFKGPEIVINKINAGTVGANGVITRSFDLPGYDYSMLGTAHAVEFYEKNKWVATGYRFIVGAFGAWALSKQSPRFSQGIATGTVARVITDVVQNTGMLAQLGIGRMYRSGTGLMPGTNPIFTNPAQRFLANRNGAGAPVGKEFLRKAPTMVENPFTN